MEILSTKNLRKEIIDGLKNHKFKNKILLLSKNPTEEVNHYKQVIIKRCKEFEIEYIDKIFQDESQEEILDYINSSDKDNGFIILAPFAKGEDLSLLKENVELKDLDSFTYKSLGRVFDGDKNSLPATARAVVRFMDSENVDFKGKRIVIANNTNVIGRPLAIYLASQRASVTIINSLTKNSKELIKNSDIFISAIGRAENYDKTYFVDGQLIVDVGTTYKNGKILGDIDLDSISKLDLKYLGSKNGIGSITTITLLEGLMI
ncbi:bifunctional 5,10-methylenetetrahydrofolate dehydrogenase/5,10-methenyltetrahydrofolate cyclohydrolase [uncultured Anaerococcus sp.]|uniref:bifunctional 5,10-methylenetetrahydrofolate dehydrogenase/5,10-methenyltetrahydrofolate cyclohydrolase n=1 Tax=uncultured Anaerococcus sp. TaxID=293428 RepID=UPI0028896629|nr:bifunctional 5,10-methylenetetrahydrofolate dehydrogenase/5,10-methenyltetrahydrofolate cyclohydrolase [uncultured Anaerococcus sp.]